MAGVLLAAGWQTATVHYNYGGNWTALFCTGTIFAAPPEVAAGTYVFHRSNGYDGQFYRYVAHDPWLQRGWSRHMDQPAIRCSRVLVPGLAWLLAGGQDRYIDAAYIAVILLWVGLGIYWLALCLASLGRNPGWGLLFLLMPSTLISIDRLTVDIALVALTAAWVWYIRSDSPVRLYLVLVLAGLTRETGLVLAIACTVHALRDRRWRKAALYASAALPALVWYWWVSTHVGHVHINYGADHAWWYNFRPLVGLLGRLFVLNLYPFGPLLSRVAQALDFAALGGILLAFVVAAWGLRKGRFDQQRWAVAGFLLMLMETRGGFWRDVYGYARPSSPFLLLVGLGAATGSPWLLVPIALIDVRIAAQLAPQAWGILRGIF